ncbi:MAG: chemotaxis protein CheW, partial [Candidatus Margulisiibacteriota bacterium]
KERAVTKIPTKVPYLMGVIQVRNQVIPLITMKKKMFDVEETGTLHNILIVNEPHVNRLIGLLVDEVLEVATIPDAIIDHPILFQGRAGQEMVSGIAKLTKGLVVVIDVGMIFSDKDRQAFEKAIASGEKRLNA